MPAYLHHFEIDWGWARLSEAERAIVRRHEARAQADPASHTLVTLKEALAAASGELPGRELRSRAEDERGEYALTARAGQCAEGGDDFDEGGRFPDVLTAADYRAAGVEKLSVGLYWPEGMLQAVQTQATRLDRSLSWVVQRALVVARDATPRPAVDSGLPRDGNRRKQSIYLPIDLYVELTEVAAREDCSLSSVVQRALTTAWRAITSP